MIRDAYIRRWGRGLAVRRREQGSGRRGGAGDKERKKIKGREKKRKS
jgi:hypothetical protein